MATVEVDPPVMIGGLLSPGLEENATAPSTTLNLEFSGLPLLSKRTASLNVVPRIPATPRGVETVISDVALSFLTLQITSP
jgi:hypothetical protein